MNMQQVSKSDFKAHALEYLRAVEKNKKPLLVTHGGKPVIKVSAYQEDPDAILKSLRGSVISYTDIVSPVGDDEWEAMK